MPRCPGPHRKCRGDVLKRPREVSPPSSAEQCMAAQGQGQGHRESGVWGVAAEAAAAAAGEPGSPGKWTWGNAEGSEPCSPAASELLETLLPAENDVQVKTSVEPKERTPRTRPRIETLPLASPGQKVFPIPGEEGSAVKQGSACGTQHLLRSLQVQDDC